MKVCCSRLLVFLVLAVLCTQHWALAQTPSDSSLALRNLRQQLFAVEFVNSHRPVSGLNTSDQVVRFIADMADAWSHAVSSQSTDYRRLNTYVPMWSIHQLLKAEIDIDTECAVWRSLAALAFVDDVLALEDHVDSVPETVIEYSHLIRVSNLSWAINPAVRCEQSRDEWIDLQTALLKYPGVIRTYERLITSYEDNHGAREINPEELDRNIAAADRARPALWILDALYSNDLSAASVILETELPRSENQLWRFVELGKRLVILYQQSEDSEQALATLDLLAAHTSEESFPRVELQGFYEKADSRLGLSRFEAAIADQPVTLDVSEFIISVEGEIVDARTLELINLATLPTQLTMLDFWSVSCGPCIDEIPELNGLNEQFGSRFNLISINTDALDGVDELLIQDFVSSHDIKYMVVLDNFETALMDKFGVFGWPTRFLIDESGHLLMNAVEKRTKLSLREISEYLAAY